MINDTSFLNSDYCNVNLVDQSECPLVTQLIYENFMKEKEKSRSPKRPRISMQKSTSRGNFRVNDEIKSRLQEHTRSRTDLSRKSILETRADTQTSYQMETRQSHNGSDVVINSIQSEKLHKPQFERDIPVAKENENPFFKKSVPITSLSNKLETPKLMSIEKHTAVEPDSDNEYSLARQPDKIMEEPRLPTEVGTNFSKYQVDTSMTEEAMREPTGPSIQDRETPKRRPEPEITKNFESERKSDRKPQEQIPIPKIQEQTVFINPLHDDPFIKRLNELKGVYNEMKKQIKAQEDPHSNFFSNIKRASQEHITPGFSSNNQSMEASMQGDSINDLSLDQGYKVNRKGYAPPQQRLNMISGRELRERRLQKITTNNKNNVTAPIINEPYNLKGISYNNYHPRQENIVSIRSSEEKSLHSMSLNPKVIIPPINTRSLTEKTRTTDQSLSRNESNTSMFSGIKPPRPFSFGKQRAPSVDKAQVHSRRPDPREIKEKYTYKYANKAQQKNKTIDIITIGEVSNGLREHERSYESLIPRDYSASTGNSKQQLAIKKPEILMPLKVRSKSALRVLKDVSPDEKFEYDESYIELCDMLSSMLANYTTIRNGADADIGINSIVTEFRKYNPMLLKLSHFTVSEIIRSCNVLIFKNQTLYNEGEHNHSSYIILYGAVYLKSKMMGLFKQCLIGDSLGEESVLEQKASKYETAKVVDETAVIELTYPFMEKLRIILKEAYPSDFMILTQAMKKNLMQKKSLRAIGSIKV